MPTGYRGNHILILASEYSLAYRAVRCFAETGMKVSVAGSKEAKPLSMSRFVATNLSIGDLPPVVDLTMQQAINDIIARLGIDLVAAADTPAIRFLIANHSGLDAPCFPLPDAEQHRRLNNKGAFRELCASLDVLIPKGFVCTDGDAIVQEVASRQLSFPVILKPVASQGGRGITLAGEKDIGKKARQLSYSPILVEKFVRGADIGLSVYATNGRVVQSICHYYEGGLYEVIDNPTLLNAAEKILAEVGCSGVFNFDAIHADDGATYVLECNPRFYYKMSLTLLTGLNLPALGVQPGYETSIERRTAYAPKALVREFLSTARLSRAARRDAKFWIKDPLPFAYEILGLNHPL